MRYTLKLTNPKGAVKINGKRFERNTLGNRFNHADSIQYSCKDWAMEDKKKYEDSNPNLKVEII